MQEFVKRVSSKIPKLSAKQVENVLNAVSEENDMLFSVFESLSFGLIIVDNAWHILSNNKASERLVPFKVRHEDNRGETMPLWELVDDSEMATFFKDCFQKDKTNVSSEFTTSTSGGATRFINIALTPFIKQHTMTGAIITVSDITEKRNQDVLLRRMENLAGLTNLAANMAHEIKNPLGAISIHIQLIQKTLQRARKDGNNLLPDEKFLEKYLSVINEEIDALNKIVVDFLFAVRPVQANFVLINPAPLLRRFIEFFKPQFDQNNVELELIMTDEAPRLLLDEKLFKEATANIAQNALAAIAEKQTKGRVTIKAAQNGDRFIITFADNGIGMSKKTALHVFEPYYTTKVNGTGLGMTMVYKIIKEFGGDITVVSKRGKGTTFTISLPVPQTETMLLSKDKNMRVPAL